MAATLLLSFLVYRRHYGGGTGQYSASGSVFGLLGGQAGIDSDRGRDKGLSWGRGPGMRGFLAGVQRSLWGSLQMQPLYHSGKAAGCGPECRGVSVMGGPGNTTPGGAGSGGGGGGALHPTTLPPSFAGAPSFGDWTLPNSIFASSPAGSPGTAPTLLVRGPR